MTRKTLGLALGSGGARGLSHIGIIRALEAAEIPIDYIAGASIGAFIGAMYVAEELDAVEDFFQQMDWRILMSYFDVVFPTSGLLDGNRVYELLTQHLLDLRIEDARLPFCCIATDLVTGEEIHLKSGAIADAVRASISIPGIFTPFEHEGQFLGDGGIVNPVPVNVARQMGADIVLAVNLNHRSQPIQHPSNSDKESLSAKAKVEENQSLEPEAQLGDSQVQKPNEKTQSAPDLSTIRQNLLTQIQQRYESIQESFQEKLNQWMPESKSGPNIFDVIGLSLNVMEQSITQKCLTEAPADLLLQPDLSQFGIFDFHQAAALIQVGYEAMEPEISHLRQLLND